MEKQQNIIETKHQNFDSKDNSDNSYDSCESVSDANYDYDITLDQENAKNLRIHLVSTTPHMQYLDSEHLKIFLESAHKTRILSIYMEAAHATKKWFDDIDRHKEDTLLNVENFGDVESDLASVLTPFQNKINELNAHIDFGMMNDLDVLFFGITPGGYWRNAYKSPKIGTIISSDDECRNVVTQHGLSTMWINSYYLDEYIGVDSITIEDDIYIDCFQHEYNMKYHIAKVVLVLDELNYH